jgi:hypothetical protein
VGAATPRGAGKAVVLGENGLVRPVVLGAGATAWGQGNGLRAVVLVAVACGFGCRGA